MGCKGSMKHTQVQAMEQHPRVAHYNRKPIALLKSSKWVIMLHHAASMRFTPIHCDSKPITLPDQPPMAFKCL